MTWEEKDLGNATCIGCRKEFIKKTETQKFCKQTCRMKYHYIPTSLRIINCPHCGEGIDLKLIKEKK